MKQILLIFLLLVFFSMKFSYAQTIDLHGKVLTSLDVENIHVVNKTSKKYAITNELGEFNIAVKRYDTLVVSSIQHKLESFVVDDTMIEQKTIVVALEPSVNSLDEVVVGKVLSGDMLMDIQNVEGTPVTAKSLGIPSYQGKPKTQAQRLLKEATSGGGIIPLNPIINAITGRTKKLKLYVELEKKEILMYRIKSRLEDDLFGSYTLDEDHIMDYFYFVSEDENFLERCNDKNDIFILEFLVEKLQEYKQNLKN